MKIAHSGYCDLPIFKLFYYKKSQTWCNICNSYSIQGKNLFKLRYCINKPTFPKSLPED